MSVRLPRGEGETRLSRASRDAKAYEKLTVGFGVAWETILPTVWETLALVATRLIS